MIRSYYASSTGAMCVSTREENRFLTDLLAEIPDAQVATCAAPGGMVRSIRPPLDIGAGLQKLYTWLMEAGGRIGVVYDFHMLVNTPGHWRALAEALPALRQAPNAQCGSLVIFVAPSWSLKEENPLKGLLPILDFHLPTRDKILGMCEQLHPMNGQGEAVADALAGLSSEQAEQVASESLALNNLRWDPAHLLAKKKKTIEEAGLEIWEPITEIGGLAGFKQLVNDEIVPFIRDQDLAIRRVLGAGLPGTGKSYGARWLANQLGAGCMCARMSIPRLKQGIVGASEGNLRRALQTADTLALEVPLVLVIDEIDTIAREGLDGGTSSGMFAELLTWLQESKSKCIVFATLNRLDKLDAALESRFQARLFYDLPSQAEREAIALIHYTRLRCTDPAQAAQVTAAVSADFSGREIAEYVCPTVARMSGRMPTPELIREICQGFSPAAKTQEAQLTQMRQAASSLRLANDPREAQPAARRGGRNLKGA